MGGKIGRMGHGAWRMAILFFLFIDGGGLYAQEKVSKMDGTFYLANDVTVRMNDHVVRWIEANFDQIISIEGKTVYLVPVEKQFKRRLRTRIIDGYIVQYAYTGAVTPVVSLQKPRTKFIEFDFKKKAKKEVAKNDDNDDPGKPTDAKLKEKVKEKDEKDKVSPGLGTGPGMGKP